MLSIRLSKLLLVELPTAHPTMTNMLELNDKSTVDLPVDLWFAPGSGTQNY